MLLHLKTEFPKRRVVLCVVSVARVMINIIDKTLDHSCMLSLSRSILYMSYHSYMLSLSRSILYMSYHSCMLFLSRSILYMSYHSCMLFLSRSILYISNYTNSKFDTAIPVLHFYISHIVIPSVWVSESRPGSPWGTRRDGVSGSASNIYCICSRNLRTFFSILAADKSECVKYAGFFCGGLDLGFILV